MNALAQPFTVAFHNGKYGILHICRGVKEFLPCDNQEEAFKIADKANRSTELYQSTWWNACEAQILYDRRSPIPAHGHH